MEEIRFLPAGDRALVIEFGNAVDETINAGVHQLAAALKRRRDPAVIETVPTFRSLLVHYDPAYRKYGPMCAWLREMIRQMPAVMPQTKRILRVPVCYGARFGTDLHDMEKLLHLDMDEIIAIHSSTDYKIYMLGFLPGFAYLGGLDSRIACPRLSSPRVRIEPGSVGIGGEQTGIYPLASPGGWRLIGRTPINLYDPSKNQPTLVRAGDYIRFVPIGLMDWYDIRREVSLGRYQPEVVCEGMDEEKSAELSEKRTEVTGSGLKQREIQQEQRDRKMKLTVLAAGALTTVQDSGRFGRQDIGVTQAGAMDLEAYRLANRLVENDGNEAVLEMTATGASFCVEGRGLIAVTGADMEPKLNGVPLPLNQAAEVRSGDVFESGHAVSGCRSYLAVSGGIDVPPVMGSRSTDLTCGIGGFHGRALLAKDVLTCAEPPIVIGGAGSRRGKKKKPYSQSVTLRFVPGPQADLFSEESMQAFQQAVYAVDEKSNRMGYRLEGPAVTAAAGTDIISDGIVAGSIQIPANGKPIVLMSDHQTTGGYAKIGTVISADLPKLAQLMPRGKVRFCAVTVEQAQQ